MRTSLVITAVMIIAAAAVTAQEQPLQTGGDTAVQAVKQQRRARMHQPGTESKKKTQIPSIIQSELDRSRAESLQHPSAQASAFQPAVQNAPGREPLWPVLLSVFIAACATAAIIFFLFLKKPALFARSRRAASGVGTPAAGSAPASAQAAPPVAARPNEAPAAAEAPAEAASGFFSEEDLVESASPYAIDEENEMPEAALTMNLINKKRETKKEVMQDVMRRVQRKEKPQQIAEDLHVGIGEVNLAITLEKLKK